MFPCFSPDSSKTVNMAAAFEIVELQQLLGNDSEIPDLNNSRVREHRLLSSH
jgi:hypothetical protein